MRLVTTRPPSFPRVQPNEHLTPQPGQVWQVLCGDSGHWRVGLYSPAATRPEDCPELERHDCPELFLLLEGHLTLLIARDRQVVTLPLEPGKPVLVTAAHAGFCPDGPHAGRALVVERDEFETEYGTPAEHTESQTLVLPRRQ
jgi:hypothetical protein